MEALKLWRGNDEKAEMSKSCFRAFYLLKQYDVINVLEKIADRAKTGKGKNMESNEEKLNNVEDNEQIEELEEDAKADEGKERIQQNKEKLFTQEEVNSIVKKRLYERRKEKEEYSEKEKKLDDREASIILRENKIRCHELIIENDYPKELLEILDTSDPEKFNEQAEKLAITYKVKKQESKKVYPGAERNPRPSYGNAKPFSNVKHVPKQY